MLGKQNSREEIVVETKNAKSNHLSYKYSFIDMPNAPMNTREEILTETQKMKLELR